MLNVELVSYNTKSEDVCGDAAAFCRGIDNPEPQQKQKSLKHATDAGHESIIEFAHIVFKASKLSRVTSHQLVRHRLFSFAQVSQRHSNPRGFIIPPTINDNEVLKNKFLVGMDYLINLYNELVDNGIPREDARYVLAEASETGIFIGGNARQWKHFFEERYCTRAQWEIRELAKKCLVICKQILPNIFDQTYPDCKNCPEPCGNPQLIIK